MGNFFGNIDDDSFQVMRMMGNGWIYAFFVVGACLLAASWLVAWQVKRVQAIAARLKAEEEAAINAGNRSSPEPPRVEGR